MQKRISRRSAFLLRLVALLAIGQLATAANQGPAPTNSRYASQLRAAADFDEDGFRDLVSVGNGQVTVQPGSFRGALLPSRIVSPVLDPDFIGAGDFDADGHWDIVVAKHGSSILWLLRGYGNGMFAEPHPLELPGTITAFATGEVNRADGLT